MEIQEIQGAVGHFFEQLAARVLGGRPVLNGTLDLGVARALVGVEVKGGNNSNRFRVSVEQLEEHLNSNLMLFPDMLKDLVYCFCCYKNPRISENGHGNGDGNGNDHCDDNNGNGTRTTLSCCEDERGVFLALAKYVDSVYILDHRIILAFKDILGTMTGKFLCSREIAVIPVGRTYLKGFAPDQARETLLSLKLSPDEWVSRERAMHIAVQVGDVKQRGKFRIVEVLPRELMKRLDRVTRPPSKRSSRRTLILEAK